MLAPALPPPAQLGVDAECRPRTRVLLVDDEPNFLSALSRALCLTGRYEPCAEPDGFNALQRAREFHPDVVLMDVMMPGLNGERVAAQLHAASATRNVPIIFLTALVMVKDGQDLPLCCDGEWFLPKPVMLDVLERAIQEALARPLPKRRGNKPGPRL